MDRTLIAPWKAEERELSDKLYKKLLGLMLLHPPTEEFRKCFNEEMFLKPNPPAFFQVMHYLFKILDPIEFRKRFYWPINDKKAEANFRSSTIEYLKYLDERYQLHWSNIKSYLVQMPGGMKFINFLLNLVSFVIQEQIKQREKYMTCDVDGDSDLNLTRMRKQNEFLKEYASAYISEADALIVKLKGKTALVKNELMQISKITSVEFAQLIDDTFSNEFEASNRDLFLQKYSKPAANIRSLEDSLQGLREAIEKFQNKKTELQIDEDAVRRSLKKIQELFPDHGLIDEDFNDTSKIRIGTLISAFNILHSSIEEQLKVADKMPRCSSFVTNELSALQIELQQIESQIMDFQKKLNAHMKRKSALKLQKCTPLRGDLASSCGNPRDMRANDLLMKFVATPPIKFEIIEGSRNTNTRLPFLEDFALNPERCIVAGAKAGMDTLNNILALPRSERKVKNSDVSMDLNSTINRSKIIDSVQLLRTINKDASKSKLLVQQHDRPALNYKWKERQSVFGKDIDATSVTIANDFNEKNKDVTIKTGDQSIQHKLSQPSKVISPLTPLNSNDRTRIAWSHGLDITCAAGNVLLQNKLSAVKKVQDASLNIHNLSTSPSGRLEPLVTMDEKDLPKLLLNDASLSDEHILANDYEILRDSPNKCFKPAVKPSSNETEQNNENGGNLTNAGYNFEFNMSRYGDENEIFNISDSVLKDVIM